jgi:hypothetical protein
MTVSSMSSKRSRKEGDKWKWGGAIVGVVLLTALAAFASTSTGSLTFTNTKLSCSNPTVPCPDGNSEP